MCKTNSQRQSPALEGKIPCLQFYLFFNIGENKRAILNDRWTQILKYLKYGQRRIYAAMLFISPLLLDRPHLNVGCKESLNLEETGIPNMTSESTSGKNSRKHRPWNGRGLQAIMTGTSQTPCLATGHFRKRTWLLAQEIMEQILWWKQFWQFGHSAIFCNILRDGRNLLGNCFLCATSQQDI